MTKYEFMQDMLVRARNRHRRELGLCPEAPEAVGPTPLTAKQSSSTDGQAGVFDGKPETSANSTGIGGDCANCGRENVPVYSYTTKDETQTVDVCENCLKILP